MVNVKLAKIGLETVIVYILLISPKNSFSIIWEVSSQLKELDGKKVKKR